MSLRPNVFFWHVFPSLCQLSLSGMTYPTDIYIHLSCLYTTKHNTLAVSMEGCAEYKSSGAANTRLVSDCGTEVLCYQTWLGLNPTVCYTAKSCLERDVRWSCSYDPGLMCWRSWVWTPVGEPNSLQNWLSSAETQQPTPSEDVS